MARVRLAKALIGWHEEDQPRTKAMIRIAELEHEIRTMQASAREVIRHAEKLAREKGAQDQKRKDDARIAQLEHALKATGEEWVCPECGSFIHPDNIIRREHDA